jgi:hypothetical protein
LHHRKGKERKGKKRNGKDREGKERKGKADSYLQFLFSSITRNSLS